MGFCDPNLIKSGYLINLEIRANYVALASLTIPRIPTDYNSGCKLNRLANNSSLRATNNVSTGCVSRVLDPQRMTMTLYTCIT